MHGPSPSLALHIFKVQSGFSVMSKGPLNMNFVSIKHLNLISMASQILTGLVLQMIDDPLQVHVLFLVQTF